MEQTRRPTVVFVMVVQLKWSALWVYSKIGIETPELERLASEGMRIEIALTLLPLCVPARTSVVTSRSPHSTGCRRSETLMPLHETHAFRVWKTRVSPRGLSARTTASSNRQNWGSTKQP